MGFRLVDGTAPAADRLLAAEAVAMPRPDTTA
jgi:hypothetical protein